MRWLLVVGFVGCSNPPTRDAHTCGFIAGDETPIECSPPGSRCEDSNWEHDCDCWCGSNGWWDCTGTVGSQCPRLPVVDAGAPDVIPIEWAACSRIEAETIGQCPGWELVQGSNLSGGFGLAANLPTPLVFDFTGTTFGVRHAVAPYKSPMTITIDGDPTIVEGYATAFSITTTPIASGLANAAHHVTTVCDGISCDVDYFDVTCN